MTVCYGSFRGVRSSISRWRPQALSSSLLRKASARRAGGVQKRVWFDPHGAGDRTTSASPKRTSYFDDKHNYDAGHTRNTTSLLLVLQEWPAEVSHGSDPALPGNALVLQTATTPRAGRSASASVGRDMWPKAIWNCPTSCRSRSGHGRLAPTRKAGKTRRARALPLLRMRSISFEEDVSELNPRIASEVFQGALRRQTLSALRVLPRLGLPRIPPLSFIGVERPAFSTAEYERTRLAILAG